MNTWKRLAILGLSSLSVVGCSRAQPRLAPEKPQEVVVVYPTTDEVRDYENFTGRTEAFRTVEVRARVTGYLEKIDFVDGDEVKEGDLLFEIDSRPYDAELKRSEGNLRQAEARHARLERDHQRALGNYRAHAISREEYEKVAGDYAEASGNLTIAKANVDMAQLNVSYTKVKASLSGRLSRRQVDPGNLIRADDTLLTTIVAEDPMYVYFDVDERTLLRLRRLVREGKIHSRQEGDVPVNVELSDEKSFPHKGLINFSENKLDPNTGTLRVRGSIENPKPRVFSSGLFVRVQLPVGEPHKALLIPEQALGTDQGGKYVFVVQTQLSKDKKSKIEAAFYRKVRVGASKDGFRVVDDGIAPRERVVVSGLQRIRSGKEVIAKMMESPAKQGPGAPATKGDRKITAVTDLLPTNK
jgi:RND family efflux transporter MFP subunit